jgi:hypothetical protein
MTQLVFSHIIEAAQDPNSGLFSAPGVSAMIGPLDTLMLLANSLKQVKRVERKVYGECWQAAFGHINRTSEH